MEFAPVTKGYYLEGLAIDGSTIWYSDVIEGGVRRLEADGTSASWLADRHWIGGLLLNEDGCVLSSGPGGIVWFNPANGASGVLLDAIDGKPVGGVNEMRPDGRGGLYFGTIDLPAIVRGESPGPSALYHLDTDGKLTCLDSDLVFCNGIGVSSDGRRLYHNESFAGVFAYDLAADGSPGKRRMLFDKKDCDGIALDTDGNIWISGFSSGELLCMQPDGSIVQRLALPRGAATNLRFGGEDGRDLYITVVMPESAAGLADGILPTEQDSVLYRGRSEVAGQVIPRTQFRLG